MSRHSVLGGGCRTTSLVLIASTPLLRCTHSFSSSPSVLTTRSSWSPVPEKTPTPLAPGMGSSPPYAPPVVSSRQPASCSQPYSQLSEFFPWLPSQIGIVICIGVLLDTLIVR